MVVFSLNVEYMLCLIYKVLDVCVFGRLCGRFIFSIRMSLILNDKELNHILCKVLTSIFLLLSMHCEEVTTLAMSENRARCVHAAQAVACWRRHRRGRWIDYFNLVG
jgi:hypothetical protein